MHRTGVGCSTAMTVPGTRPHACSDSHALATGAAWCVASPTACCKRTIEPTAPARVGEGGEACLAHIPAKWTPVRRQEYAPTKDCKCRPCAERQTRRRYASDMQRRRDPEG